MFQEPRGYSNSKIENEIVLAILNFRNSPLIVEQVLREVPGDYSICCSKNDEITTSATRKETHQRLASMLDILSSQLRIWSTEEKFCRVNLTK